MKKFFVFTVAAALLLSFAACAQNVKPAVQPEPAQQEETMLDNQQIPNPWTDCASEEEAAQLAGFDLTAPDAISGAGEKSYRVMTAEDAETISEIDYASGEDRAAHVRKAAGAEDISGDYNVYEEEQTVEAGSVSVTLKGNDGLVYLAVWTDGGYSYALNVTAGLSQSEMTALVSEIR